MTDERTVLLLRVQEFAAWFPMAQDPNAKQLVAISGEAGIELAEGERLVDIEVLPTDQTRFVPVPNANSKQPDNIKVKLVVFRATLARTIKGELPPDNMPDVPNKNDIVMPPGHQNREARRKANGS